MTLLFGLLLSVAVAVVVVDDVVAVVLFLLMYFVHPTECKTCCTLQYFECPSTTPFPWHNTGLRTTIG